MSDEKFLNYIEDVYYYSLDERWESLRNILFLFTKECNCKDGMLLLYLAKHFDFDLLFDYMDTLRRGRDINLKLVQDDAIEKLMNGDLESAKYLIDFIGSKGKGTHQEVNMPYLRFAYNFISNRLRQTDYKSLEYDLTLEQEVMDELNKSHTIKDVVSTDKLDSLKKEFIMKLYPNISTYSCSDMKGRYHTFAKVNEEIIDLDIDKLINKVDYEIYLGRFDKAKEIVRKGLVHTEGFNPELVRLYNKLFKNEKITRLERRICESEKEDTSYNVLYSYSYGFDNLDELLNQIKKRKEIDVTSYTEEEKGLLYLLIAREAFKKNIINIGNEYLKKGKKYKNYPEVNYLYNYVVSNKDTLSYQIIQSIPDAVRLELKK